MANKKKIIISIVVGLVVLAIVVAGTVIALNVISNNNAKTVVPTKATADELRLQAEAARKKADTATSKKLLLEAQQQYKTLPKTDANTNAQVDIDAQLWLLNHPTTPPATPTPSAAPATP